MHKKRIIVISMLIISIILILFFIINYKTQKFGNNISKSSNDIARYILNISSYEADLEVTIESNKNTNKYKMKQLYSKPNIIKQIVKEPQNLENLTIIYDGNNMRLENTNLSLSKVYEDYKYISQNTLWLSTFIDNFNDKSKIYDKKNEVIIENNTIYNNYNVKQILYVDKNKCIPTKLEILDNNKNVKIYIKYNEIRLNKLKKNDIIAFKLNNKKIEI